MFFNNDAASKLTSEHFQVLRHLARGKLNKEIAKEMSLTEATIKYRVNVLLVAFEAEHRYGIVAHAYARGILDKLTPEPRIIDELTGRQTQILGLLAAGLDTDGVSEALDVSFHTMKTITTSLFKKLKANNRGHAVALGHQHRFLINHWTAPAGVELRPGWIGVREARNSLVTWTKYPVPHPGTMSVAQRFPGL